MGVCFPHQHLPRVIVITCEEADPGVHPHRRALAAAAGGLGGEPLRDEHQVDLQLPANIGGVLEPLDRG
jgi:hypothetical protein